MGRKLKKDKITQKVEVVKVDAQLYSVIKAQVEKKKEIPNYTMNMALRELVGETKISKLLVKNRIGEFDENKLLKEVVCAGSGVV